MTDHLVRQAQAKFLPAWEKSKGDNGYVSFELDPLLEDSANPLAVAEKSKKYDRTGQEMGRRPQEPHDQGAGHAGRPGGARRIGRGRRHAERDADLFGAAIPRGPRRDLEGRPTPQVARRLQVGLQHLRQPRGSVHQGPLPRPVAGRPGTWSASSTPSGSGRSTRTSGPTRSSACSRR